MIRYDIFSFLVLGVLLISCGGAQDPIIEPHPTPTPLPDRIPDVFPPLQDEIPLPTPITALHPTIPPEAELQDALLPDNLEPSPFFEESSELPGRQPETDIHRLEEAMAHEERRSMSHNEIYFQDRILQDLNEAFPTARFVRGRNYSIMTTVGGSPFYIYLRDPTQEWLASNDQAAAMQHLRGKIVQRIGEAFGLEPRADYGR